ncbi:MAG TPA: PKD domain-containing protein, partial [Thermoplasmata archaeon]|nr:PKD domain-containing protein [Thermoplasmata archaeon]
PAATAAGPTVVFGDVAGAWAAEGNPFLVIAPAVVPESATLSIGPGVVVRFDPGTRLEVRGGLIVEGSGTATVEFTSNGSATPNAWDGIVVNGYATLRFASISYAGTALRIESGSADLETVGVSHSGTGLSANASTVTVAHSSFEMNEVAGVRGLDSRLTFTFTALGSNAEGIYLTRSAMRFENGTVSGSFIDDARVEVGGTLQLHNVTTGRVYGIYDDVSRIEEWWYAHVLVKDRFATPVADAAVRIEGGPLSVIDRTTGGDGTARWIDLWSSVMTSISTTTFTYSVSASSRGSTGATSTSPIGDTHIAIALSADITAPVAVAGPDLAAPEDTAVTLDARGSTDNDPAFPAGATFAWTFDDGSRTVSISGPSTSFTFATPRTYSVLLQVTDAAGNADTDLLLVTVLDRTPPVAAVALPPQSYPDEAIVLDARASMDNDPAFNETGNFTWTLESGGRTATTYGRTASFAGWWAAGDYLVTLRVRDAGGNEDLTTGSIRVVPRPSIDLVWIVAALLAWFAGLAIAGTERGRMAFITWFVLPLYTRMKKEEVLDQFTRGQIYGYIVVHPGDSYVDIKRNLQLNNGTLTHHLNVLERDGMVRSKNQGTRKLFFAAGARVPEDGGGMHEVQQQIMKHLQESGGLAVSDVAGVIGISRQLAIYHLRDMSRKGLVRIERRAFRIVAYAELPEFPPPPS